MKGIPAGAQETQLIRHTNGGDGDGERTSRRCNLSGNTAKEACPHSWLGRRLRRRALGRLPVPTAAPTSSERKLAGACARERKNMANACAWSTTSCARPFEPLSPCLQATWLKSRARLQEGVDRTKRNRDNGRPTHSRTMGARRISNHVAVLARSREERPPQALLQLLLFLLAIAAGLAHHNNRPPPPPQPPPPHPAPTTALHANLRTPALPRQNPCWSSLSSSSSSLKTSRRRRTPPWSARPPPLPL